MASIHKEIIIDASPDHVWDALRDFGALHTRLVPGFVTDTKLDGDARIVTFSNGTVAREILVDCDDKKRRLVYAIVSERIKQHSASAQVFAESDGRTRFVWIADVLPNEIAPYMDAQMDLGLARHAEGIGTQRRMISAFLDALGADGPSADRAGKMDLYGRFVGSWDLDVRQFSEDGRERRRAGEWHFGWALEGRAIQDVWIVPPRGELRHGDAAANFNSYGTTLRVYDPDIDAWRIQWTDPVTRNFLQMIGRAEGRDIVQLGTRPDGQLARWSFSRHHRRFIPLARRSLGGCGRNMARRHRVHRPPQGSVIFLTDRLTPSPSLARMRPNGAAPAAASA